MTVRELKERLAGAADDGEVQIMVVGDAGTSAAHRIDQIGACTTPNRTATGRCPRWSSYRVTSLPSWPAKEGAELRRREGKSVVYGALG